jgi:hypothetical protein
MLIDRQSTVSLNQAITATAVSTDSIDLRNARDLGAGDPIELVIICTQSVAGGASINFELITSANSDLSSPTSLVSTGAIAVASITAGTEWLRIRVPVADLSRYLGVRYTVVGTPTAGTFTATFTADQNRQANRQYASGVPVGGY